MDRRVKERLVGASILVVLVVLFVPELLSGPKRAVIPPSAPGTTVPMRSVTIDLTTNKATAGGDPSVTGTVAGEPPATASPDNPAGGSAAPDAGSGASTVAPAAATPNAAPTATSPDRARMPAAPPADEAVAAATATKAQPARRGWVVQLGSFAARDNAEKLERQLRSQGFSPFLSALGAGPTLRFRVRLGPVVDRSAAQTLVAKLGKAGHPATLVAP